MIVITVNSIDRNTLLSNLKIRNELFGRKLTMVTDENVLTGMFEFGFEDDDIDLYEFAEPKAILDLVNSILNSERTRLEKETNKTNLGYLQKSVDKSS